MMYFMKQYDKDHKSWKGVNVHLVMNENNVALSNTSLFLDLDEAVSQSAERILGCEHSDLLMVVLSLDAMPVANQIATELGLNLAFSAADINAKAGLEKVNPVDFDYGMVKESGRDIPQDFIVHQERNLRSGLLSIYEKIYESMVRKYPGKVIIMVDQLINIGARFFPSLTRKYMHQSGGNSFSVPSVRRFIFLHAANRNSENTITPGFDIIIEHSFAEAEQR
jgi:hypothetical protein